MRSLSNKKWHFQSTLLDQLWQRLIYTLICTVNSILCSSYKANKNSPGALVFYIQQIQITSVIFFIAKPTKNINASVDIQKRFFCANFNGVLHHWNDKCRSICINPLKICRIYLNQFFKRS
jgi:hypothetical protein